VPPLVYQSARRAPAASTAMTCCTVIVFLAFALGWTLRSLFDRP